MSDNNRTKMEKAAEVASNIAFMYVLATLIFKQKRFFRYNYLIPIWGVYLFIKDFPRFKEKEEDPTMHIVFMVMAHPFFALFLYELFFKWFWCYCLAGLFQ